MRVILHSDLNNFYASVECARNPELKGKAVIVIGDKEARHGIVLAKNMIAKEAGIETGEVVWQARGKCPDLIEVNADFKEYIRVSRQVRAIYEQYTDRIEAFGIDECWLDVTESGRLFGDGIAIAERIRNEIKTKLGITVSIGVSYNKIFAKLASEIKKPDAVTIIDRNNYQEVAWHLPVEDLLYVGRATKLKLNKMSIYTIGDLARADRQRLADKLGKWGIYLSIFARGEDNSEVRIVGEADMVKSIGNSLTAYRDLECDEDVEALIYLLADSVAARLREGGYGKAIFCHFSFRDNHLAYYAKQSKMSRPTLVSADIAAEAMKMFRELSFPDYKVRSVSVSVSGFDNGVEQLSIDNDTDNAERSEKLERTVDKIREKYGQQSIKRAVVDRDAKLGALDIRSDHTIHPVSFFKNKKDHENK